MDARDLLEFPTDAYLSLEFPFKSGFDNNLSER